MNDAAKVRLLRTQRVDALITIHSAGQHVIDERVFEVFEIEGQRLSATGNDLYRTTELFHVRLEEDRVGQFVLNQ